MREIKFDYIFEYADTKKLFHKVFSLEDIENGKMVYSSNSCIAKRQYTGLKDKNGVEIYEGDIVCNEGFKEKVYWDQFYGWVVSDEAMLGEVNFASIKVIGNIYENHELLEQL